MAAEIADEFNRLAFELLKKLEKVLPAYARDFRDAALKLQLNIDIKTKSANIEFFAKLADPYLHMAADSGREEKFIFESGSAFLHCELKEVWTGLSEKTKQSLIQYLSIFFQLATSYQSLKLINEEELKVLMAEVQPIFDAVLHGRTVQLTPEQKACYAKSYAAVQAYEKEMQKEFDPREAKAIEWIENFTKKKKCSSTTTTTDSKEENG